MLFMALHYLLRIALTDFISLERSCTRPSQFSPSWSLSWQTYKYFLSLFDRFQKKKTSTSWEISMSAWEFIKVWETYTLSKVSPMIEINKFSIRIKLIKEAAMNTNSWSKLKSSTEKSPSWSRNTDLSWSSHETPGEIAKNSEAKAKSV